MGVENKQRTERGQESADGIPESLSLDEAAKIIGNETRIRILLEIGKAWDDEQMVKEHLPYSELKQRVDVQNSGRFNYHLEKLVGPFVDQSEEGYHLNVPGRKLYRTIVSGTLTDRAGIEAIEVGRCRCDGELVMERHSGHFCLIVCRQCEQKFFAIAFSPRGFEERTSAEAIEAFRLKFHHYVSMFRESLCPNCDGRVNVELTDSLDEFWEGDYWEEGYESEVRAVFWCSTCNTFCPCDVPTVALTTPPVRRFFRDNDRDPRLCHDWDDVFIDAEQSVTVLDVDPIEVGLSFELGDERLDVHLDNGFRVISSRRHRS